MDPPKDARCFQDYGTSTAWINISTTYIFPLLSTFGIIGDFFMLLTIQFGQLTDSPYVYLKCIALANLILLLCQASLAVVFCQTCQFSLDMAYYTEFYHWYIYMMIVNLMKAWLALLTLTMTIERFVYVRWPMKTRSLCTRERARNICIAIFLMSCTSAILIPFQIKLEIEDRNYAKSGTTIRASHFRCAPSQYSSETEFACYSEDHPAALHSNSNSSMCSDDRVKAEHKLGKQSSYSSDCLHKLCRLPQVPKGLNYTFSDISVDWGLLVSSYRGKTILVVTNRTTKDSDHKYPSREELIGRALRVNNSCKFMVAPRHLKPILSAVSRYYREKHQVIVKCVKPEPRAGWQAHFTNVYLRISKYMHVVCTGVLAFFNVLIVLEVRRANREARSQVLSDNKQQAAVKRAKDELRLTMSLLTLSSVNILTDVLFITSWAPIARWFYVEVDPPGPSLKIHKIISSLAYVVEYSAYFYLLAFINRKFKQEFIQRVMYDGLQAHKILGGFRSIFSISSRTTSLANSQNTRPPRSAPGQSEDDRIKDGGSRAGDDGIP